MPPILLAIALALLTPVFALAQADAPTSPTPPASEEVTKELINAQAKAAAESPDLDEETKTKIAELYKQAAEALDRVKKYEADATRFKTDAENVQERLRQIQQQQAALLEKPELSFPPIDSIENPSEVLAERKQDLAKLELELAELKKAQAASEAEATRRAARRKEIRERLFSAPERLADVKKELETPPPANEPPLLTLARRAQQRARLAEIEQEMAALQNELAMYDAEETVDLVRLERTLKTDQANAAAQAVRKLQKRVQALEAQVTRQALLKAQEEAIAAEPLLRPYAKQNREFIEEADSLSEPIRQIDLALNGPNGIKPKLEALQAQFEQTKAKVDSVGLTAAIGSLLRRQKAALPSIRKHELDVKQRREVIDETQFELLKYDDLLRELPTAEATVAEVLQESGRQLSKEEYEELLAAAELARERRAEYLNRLIRNYNTYFDALVELDNTEQKLIRLTDQYMDYINERVLWIRSGKSLTLGAFVQDAHSLVWLIRLDFWTDVGQRLFDDAAANLVLSAVALITFGLLFYFRLRHRREIKEIGNRARRGGSHEFLPTARAGVLTLLIAILWPAVVFYAAWRLNVAAGESEFAKAIATALLALAAVFGPMELLRQVCRKDGLAEAHFRWPQTAVNVLRNNLRWFIAVSLPLVFVTVALAGHDPEQGRDAWQRALFIVMMFLMTAFLARVLHPQRGVLAEYISYQKGGWIDRLKYVWYWLGAGPPVVLALLDAFGYYYTARQLSACLYLTAWLMIATVLVRSFLLRWIIVHRRKLKFEQFRQRAAAAAEAQDESTATASAAEDGDGQPLSDIAPAEEDDTDLTAISEQTGRLLNTALLATVFIGMWAIWVDVLPALNALDRWPVWTTTVNATEPVEGSETGATRTVERVENITIADVVFALVIAVITFVCARNFPGLMEMSLLQRLPLDASVRYAITCLASYAIVLIGTILGFSKIGLGWSQIQWLATALTFGLAFGLQEIFANFVAGIIILFERPIRVGDVVTIDDVTGVVSRVRMRATTITNWDRQEYVIPNKDFITGRVLNWTLTNKINRVTINVGVAYGSDTERARNLLLKVANDHPLILSEPASMATFEEFGDNSLNIALRTYLPDMENRLPIIHELHTAIDQAFREAGIEIAFPQRDLHLRTIPDGLKLRSGEQMDSPTV